MAWASRDEALQALGLGVRIFGSGFGSYCVGHRTLLGSKVELILGGGGHIQ